MKLFGAKSPPYQKNRRRRKWIRPDVQLKVVFLTLSVATIVLMLNFQLNLLGLNKVRRSAATIQETLFQFESLLIKEVLIAYCVAIPLAAWAGAIYAFKFCGPIYRFKKFFIDLKTGSWDERCTLRKGDDLLDVKDAINAGMDAIRARLSGLRSLLEEARTALGAGAPALPGQNRHLVDRIDRELKDLQARLKPGETAAPGLSLLPAPAASPSTSDVEPVAARVAD